MIQRVKQLVKRIVFKYVKPPTRLVHNTYSQSGEDVIVRFLFESMGIKSPYYLELGVYKPDIGSNTYLFYLNGSRGVCVEADSTLIDRIKEVRAEDSVLNLAVGIDDNQFLDFYVFDEPSLNTFSKSEAEYRESIGTFKVVKVVKLPVLSLNTIIEKHCRVLPDFLSIDLEGIDYEVLKSWDHSKFPIPVICVETCCYSENHIRSKESRILDHMTRIGYEVYADTYINTVFVNKQWFYERE